MNQTRRVEQTRPRNDQPVRRPKRCLVCRKMFAFDKYNEHAEACARTEQKRVQESRQRGRQARNSTVYKVSNPVKKEYEEKGARQNVQQGNRFRIKSIANPAGNTHGKSKSVLVNKKDRDGIRNPEERKKQEVDREREKEEEVIPNMQSESVVIEEPPIRQQLVRRESRAQQSVVREIPHVEQQRPIPHIAPNRQQRVQPNQTLIQPSPRALPQNNSQRGYDISALVANSNAIIEFIRSMNILSQDETMNTMLNQLQQLNLIAEQIVQLSSIGHSFGSTMGNLFAARIHELQTVITNQIGIALIRGFNQRLGSQFSRIIQGRPQISEGFSESQIEQIFPEKVNFTRKECSICLQDMRPSQLIIELQCYHHFHPDCIRQWLTSSKKCPLCRRVQQHS